MALNKVCVVFEQLSAQMLSEDAGEGKNESVLLLLVIRDPVTQCCGGIGSASC